MATMFPPEVPVVTSKEPGVAPSKGLSETTIACPLGPFFSTQNVAPIDTVVFAGITPPVDEDELVARFAAENVTPAVEIPAPSMFTHCPVASVELVENVAEVAGTVVAIPVWPSWATPEIVVVISVT